MKRVAILGGGIAGLSAAYCLEQAKREGADLEWTLFEKSNRLGGVIRTENHEGCVIEAGPDSFISAKPEGASLCRQLGLESQLIPSNDSGRKTYIVVQGRLTPIPDGLQFMVPTRVLPMATTPLFSFGTKLRMAAEWFSTPRGGAGDESVASFVRRHFGQEMVDRVAEPMLAGVFGGDAERLSVRAVLPRFTEMEDQHGSLVRATLRARKAAQQSAPQPLFTSLKNGMQQMVDALIAALPGACLRLQQEAALGRIEDGWRVESPKRGENNGTFHAVVLAVPATSATSLLLAIHPEVSGLLGKIQYTSSAAVALAFANPVLPPGHGFLVPSTEGRKMMACTFVHKKFSNRAPEGLALLRCFFSSSRLPDLLERSDDELKNFALRELKDILGLEAQPRFARAFRWSQALPQYEIGHLERAAEIESQLAKLPGLHIAGNSLYGVGIPDCIKSSRLAVKKIVSS